MHKKKVTHAALNPCCDWFLATASVDQTVKIWDLRQVKGKSSFLYSLPHSHPVNAGVIYFIPPVDPTYPTTPGLCPQSLEAARSNLYPGQQTFLTPAAEF